ncbi:MAG: POTRA domain-containing protein, partial [Chlamydiota bacterium]|nr:POTRA domain-containing protein [Chlamydiota bacterium]
MKRFYSMLMALFTSVSLLARTSPSVEEQYTGKVIGGIDVVLSEETPWDGEIGLHVGDLFSQSIFDQSLKQLSLDFDRVDPSLHIRDGKVWIRIMLSPCPEVASIEWQGNTKIRDQKLNRELGIHVGDSFHLAKFQQALAKVKSMYRKKGYFDIAIRYRILPQEDSNQVIIKLVVSEGMLGHVGSIQIIGLTEREERFILKAMGTKEYHLLTSWISGKGIHRKEMADHDRLVILNELHNLGYLNATVDFRIHEGRNGKLDIVIEVNKGEQFTFHSINFEGDYLLPSLSSKIHSGSPFSSDHLREAVEAIRNEYGRLGYIDAAVDYTLTPILDEDGYDVTFQVAAGDPFYVGAIRIVGNYHTRTEIILQKSGLIPGTLFDTSRLSFGEMMLQNTGYFKSVSLYPLQRESGE